MRQWGRFNHLTKRGKWVCQFEHLTDSHSALCHQLRHHPVSWLDSMENNLVDGLILHEVPPESLHRMPFEVYLPGIDINWILDINQLVVTCEPNMSQRLHSAINAVFQDVA